MRTRPALLAVLATVLGAVLLGAGVLLLQPSATGIGRVPAPISVPVPTSVPPVPAETTQSATPSDVVPPPPLDDDEDDDGDTDDPDDVDDDGED